MQAVLPDCTTGVPLPCGSPATLQAVLRCTEHTSGQGIPGQWLPLDGDLTRGLHTCCSDALQHLLQQLLEKTRLLTLHALLPETVLTLSDDGSRLLAAL